MEYIVLLGSIIIIYLISSPRRPAAGDGRGAARWWKWRRWRSAGAGAGGRHERRPARRRLRHLPSGGHPAPLVQPKVFAVVEVKVLLPRKCKHCYKKVLKIGIMRRVVHPSRSLEE